MSNLRMLEEVNKKLDQLNSILQGKIKRYQARIKKYEATLSFLDRKRTVLELVGVEVKKNEELAQQKQNQIKERLSKLVDLDEVLSLISQLDRLSKIRRSSASDEYYKIKKIIHEYHLNLMNAGICSDGLYAIAAMSHSRPDRDKPILITLEHLLNIREYQPQE